MHDSGRLVPLARGVGAALRETARPASAAPPLTAPTRAPPVPQVTQILPRMNFKLKVVKPKMADYEWMKWDPMCTRKPFVCFKTSKTNAYGVIDGDNCGHSFGKLGCYEQNTGIDLDDMDISALQKELAPEMGANYLQGVLTFSLFLLGIAVLSLPCSCVRAPSTPAPPLPRCPCPAPRQC